MAIKILSEGWYDCQQAEVYTGLLSRTIRRRLEDKPRDNIFLKIVGNALWIRGCILHGFKQGVTYERVVATHKSLIDEGVVHVNVSITSASGDIGWMATQAVKKHLQGKKCWAILPTGDKVEVTLQL